MANGVSQVLPLPRNFTEEVVVASVIEKDTGNDLSQPVEERTAQVAAEALASILPVIPDVADESPRGSLAVIPAPSLSASASKPVRTIPEDEYKRYVVPDLVERYKRNLARLKKCEQEFNVHKKKYGELAEQLKQEGEQLVRLKKQCQGCLIKMTGYRRCLLPEELPQEDLAEHPPEIEPPSAAPSLPPQQQLPPLPEEMNVRKRIRPPDEVLSTNPKQARLSPDELFTKIFAKANSRGQFYHLDQPISFVKFIRIHGDGDRDRVVVGLGDEPRNTVPRSECTWVPHPNQNILILDKAKYLFREITKVKCLEGLKECRKDNDTVSRRATLHYVTERIKTHSFISYLEDALPVNPDDEEILKLFKTQDDIHYTLDEQ